MSKEETVVNILNAIGDLHKEDDTKCGYMFLGGDYEAQKTYLRFSGNPEVIAEAFGRHMQNNERFNAIMMSMFGSYLSVHPEEKFRFMSMFEVTNFNN